MPTQELAPRLSLFYLDENPQGESTILLLHGLGATSRSWTLQIPALTAAGYRVIVPDMRGFGKSTYPGGAYRIEDLASDMAALLRKTGIPRTDVVGISLGGTVALSLICGYAQFINKVVLVNTFARLRPTRPASLLYYALRFALIYTLGIEPQAKAVSRHIFPKPEQEELRKMLIEDISQADPAGYRSAFTALARFDLRACLGGVRQPTLVVSGACDTTVPEAAQRELADGIPAARQVIIPEAGHAVTVDQPQAFNKVMMDFLCEDGASTV
jgi:3-oxoadipate enol-lactonase